MYDSFTFIGREFPHVLSEVGSCPDDSPRTPENSNSSGMLAGAGGSGDSRTRESRDWSFSVLRLRPYLGFLRAQQYKLLTDFEEILGRLVFDRATKTPAFSGSCLGQSPPPSGYGLIQMNDHRIAQFGFFFIDTISRMYSILDHT